MSWFRVDDSFTDHPKVKSIPRAGRRAAVGLWTLAGSYAARQLTDGFIFTDDVIDLGCTAKDAAALVKSGLWHAHGHDCPRCRSVGKDQYLYHDWLVYQRSREQVLSERAKAAERQKKAREKAASRDESRRDAPVTTSVTADELQPLVTVPPTRPDPTPSSSEGGKRPETLRSVGASEPTCTRHPNGDTGEACVSCQKVNEWRERHAERATEQAQREADEGRRNCAVCDGTGIVVDPETRLPTQRKCTQHRRTA